MTEQPKPDEHEKKPRSENLKVMGLLEHVDELRSRLVKSVLAVLVLFFVAYSYSAEMIGFLKAPLVHVLPRGTNALHFTGPMDVFMANCKLSLFVAVLLACPFWLFQFWRFIEPALYEHEKKYIVPFIVSSVSLFVFGLIFCFYLMVPVALQYLIGIGLEIGSPIITVSDYLSLLMLMMFGFGIIFETPVILILLSLLGILSADALSQNRKVVIVAIFIIAAVLTPTPDPISQFIMAIPMWLFYEISIIIIRIIDKKRNAS